MRRVLCLAFASAAVAGPALAQDSAQDGSKAVGAASEATALLGASGVKTAVGVSAVPVSVAAGGASAVGAAGASVAVGATSAAADLSKAAGASAKVALKVDDDVVVAADPAPKVPYQPAKK
ncbi:MULTISPECIES: hypothetical protein [unclassified Phenylobacterium]|uniref:hypothetical protein n=1 Tax=unclassified Phenylobacterium TaxID=2640670 RepID=UPI00083AA4F6|nr:MULTISPECIES: hypothetical protein [unclassified Phenylobacterium]